MLTLSYLVLGILLCIKKSKDDSVDFFEKIVDTLIYLVIYNGFVGFTFSFFNIKLSNINLTLVNIIVGALIILYICKLEKKQIEKFKIDIKSIVAVGTIIGFFIWVFIALYGTEMRISFETTDPATHMNFINETLKNERLLLTYNTSQLYGNMEPTTYPFLHYLNNAIFYRVIGFEEVYRSYLVFNIVLLTMLALKGYFIFDNILKKYKLNSILTSLFLVALLVNGYALNATIFGFSSQIVVFPIFVLIIDTLQNGIENLSKKQLLFIGMMITAVFWGYYYYIPELLLSVGLYILMQNLTANKESIIQGIKKSIVDGIYLFVVPLIGGLLYLYWFTRNQTIITAGESLAVEGYIWRDLFNTLLIFVPVVLYMVIDKMRSKKMDFLTWFMVVGTGFSILLFVGGMKQKVSSYYFFKNHYLLIIPTIIIIANSIPILFSNKTLKYTSVSFCTFVVLLLVGGEGKINSNNILFDPTPVTINNVYWFNGARLKNPSVIYTNEELMMLKYVRDNKKSYAPNNQIAVVGEMKQLRWFEEITGIWPKISGDISFQNLDSPDPVNMDDFRKLEEYKYIILLQRMSQEWCELNIDFDDYEIVMQYADSYLLRKVY